MLPARTALTIKQYSKALISWSSGITISKILSFFFFVYFCIIELLLLPPCEDGGIASLVVEVVPDLDGEAKGLQLF